jgi:hypothetical protein
MVAMVDPLERGMKFSLEMPGDALTEDLGDLLGGQFKEAQFTGTFEEFMNGEGVTKDEIQTILYLAESIEPVQIHGLTFPV